jgi:hypothetical protein
LREIDNSETFEATARFADCAVEAAKSAATIWSTDGDDALIACAVDVVRLAATCCSIGDWYPTETILAISAKMAA